jgi:two-component system CheB/CheR fusion protein
MSTEVDQDFEDLLEYLRQTRGFDFTGYKRSTLMRRVQKRMQMAGSASYSDYLDFLEVHPDEFAKLFNTILINVTSFLRDEPAWDFLRAEIVPRIVETKKAYEPIRVWSAGCSSGEEAYSLAIVLAEALGVDQYKERIKIYATDVDEEVLARSRQGTFTARGVNGLPEAYLATYFDQVEDHYTFRKELRRGIIFGRHDLTHDAPISRVDLLVCRNVLIYFNAETQAHILSRFHFALNDQGILFLGRAETLFAHNAIFTPLDLKWRVFAKVSKANMKNRLFALGSEDQDETVNPLATYVRLREQAFDTNTVAQIVVDSSGVLVLANELSRHLFGIDNRDIARPIQDLEISYRPVELRSLIEKSHSTRRTLNLKEIEWVLPGGEVRFLDAQIMPLHDSAGNALGTSVIFTEVTRYRRLQQELEHSNQELETAYEELQSTNEELETTNEELQSTVEELETTNEELQSTNEELETMNEELQSTNEELETINDEFRRRTDELNRVNAFLESILSSLRGAVVVVDQELHILVWNRRTEDLWGLRQDEVVGRALLNLDIGLPVERLKQPVRGILSGESESGEITTEATNRRGKAITCRIGMTPLTGLKGEIRGAILQIEEREREREREKPTDGR